jgi:Tol biopolymer transport system component
VRVFLTVVAALALGVGAAAARASLPAQAAIIYDSAVRCPASSCRGTRYDARIYEISKIGYPAHALTSGAFNDTNPVWSPDHRQIAFYRAGPSANAAPTLWLMNADGSGQHRLSSTRVGVGPYDRPSWSWGGFGGPAWSPDGKEIAFVGQSPTAAAAGDLYTIGADGTGLVDVTAGKKSLSSPGTRLIAKYPSWSPDGKEIAFETYYGEFPSTVEIAPAGSGLVLLFTRANMQAWSPDGTRFAYVVSGGGARDQILTSTPSGAAATTLTHKGDNYQPAWSPDGARIVFVRSNQITVMNADGTALKQITRHDPSVFVENPDW